MGPKLVGSRKPKSIDQRKIRIVRGPQARDKDLEHIEESVFKVSLQSNRVGIRLVGGVFDPVEEHPSEPSCIGAIQLAPSGELLIHGPDGPTVAGYPKIAVVADVDRDRLAQLRPLQEVRFELVSLENARRISVEKQLGEVAPNQVSNPS
jgi:allophanate hydrolase subunit 2